MSYSRQDRINLHKNKRGISSGEPTIDDLDEGVPVFRTTIDNETGQSKTTQYIKNKLTVLKSEFKNIGRSESSYLANWYVSKELDLTSNAGVYKMINVPNNSYVTDVKIVIATGITVGSMDIDVGDTADPDRYVNGWDGDGETRILNQIHTFGVSSGATEVGTATGYYYKNQDTINVDINTVATAGSIKLLAYIINNPIPSMSVPGPTTTNPSASQSYGG